MPWAFRESLKIRLNEDPFRDQTVVERFASYRLPRRF